MTSYESVGPFGLDEAEPLAPEEERELGRAARAGSVSARDRLVLSQLRLIWSVADGIAGLQRDEGFGVGCEVALRVAPKWDPDMPGSRFAPYLKTALRRECYKVAGYMAPLDERSLQEPVAEGLTLQDVYVPEDPELSEYEAGRDAVIEFLILAFQIANLTEDEKTALALYHGLFDSPAYGNFRDVASEMGIGRTKAHKLYTGALTRVRAAGAAMEDVI